MRSISNILPNGNFELGVHIADVSYYVTEGSALNREAVARTSVYVIDWCQCCLSVFQMVFVH